MKAFTLVPGVGAVPGAHPWIGDLSTWSGSLWLLGCLLMSLRLSWAWFRERRWFHADLVTVEKGWITRMGELCTRMKLGRKVILRASKHSGSPMTWGWLRPIVLLPASSFLNLSPDALEAVLVHELAHVRRLDYLAGLLQSMAEVLLFYHPALWWLSRQIRELRELCCDDVVMELLGDPLPYAEGLACLEHMRRPEKLRIVQASQKGNLMFRIQRMLNPDSIRLPKFNALALSATLFLASGLAGGLLLASSRSDQTSTTSSQSVRFSYSTGETKALRIEGFDIALARVVATDPDTRTQTAYNNGLKTQSDSISAIVDWTLAQLRLRLEAYRRGERPAHATFEAPPNDAKGRPREMPRVAVDMARPHRMFAIHAALEGHPGAITLHLETLNTAGPITPEREQAILQEALDLVQEIRGEGYSWTSTSSIQEVRPPMPVVALPVPATGTHFLFSSGEGRCLRIVGFEGLLPAGEFDVDRIERIESQLKAIQTWTQARLQERVKAAKAGHSKAMVPYLDRPSDVSGMPQDAVIFSAGDMTALRQGQPGQLFSIHPARNGQRASVSFRLASLAAINGRMPSKEEELRVLQEAQCLLDKQLKGELGESFRSASPQAGRASTAGPEIGKRTRAAVPPQSTGAAATAQAPDPDGIESIVVVPATKRE